MEMGITGKGCDEVASVHLAVGMVQWIQ